MPDSSSLRSRPATDIPRRVSWNRRRVSQYRPVGKRTGSFENRCSSSTSSRPSSRDPSITRPLSAPRSMARKWFINTSRSDILDDYFTHPVPIVLQHRESLSRPLERNAMRNQRRWNSAGCDQIHGVVPAMIAALDGLDPNLALNGAMQVHRQILLVWNAD